MLAEHRPCHLAAQYISGAVSNSKSKQVAVAFFDAISGVVPSRAESAHRPVGRPYGSLYALGLRHGGPHLGAGPVADELVLQRAMREQQQTPGGDTTPLPSPASLFSAAVARQARPPPADVDPSTRAKTLSEMIDLAFPKRATPPPRRPRR